MMITTINDSMCAHPVCADAYDSLGELLRDSLIRFKDHTALIEVNRKRESARLSYLDMKRQTMPVIQFLSDRGVGAGDRVAIIMSNQSKWLLAAYAVLFRGAVLVPIDYKLAPDEQAALLNHASPSLVITEASLHAQLQYRHEMTVLVTETDGVDPLEPMGASRAWSWEALCPVREEARLELVRRGRDDVATIVYSSGTGGTPKGCVLTHGNYLSQLASLTTLFSLQKGDRYFSVLPTNHAIDFMVGFLGPLSGGATVVHQRTLRPDLLRWTMQHYRITHMAVVPLLLEAFERAIREKLNGEPPWKRAILSGLIRANVALTGDSPRVSVSRALLKPIHDAFGGRLKCLFCGGAFVDPERVLFFHRLGIPVAVGYGLSEACTVATLHRLHPFRADSVGVPVPGVQVRIFEPDADGVGEVILRGPMVMKKYFRAPELTERTLVDGWLHTGDMGFLDSRFALHLVGRSKNMIVTQGGKNVYPEDIENAFEGLPCEELVVVASNYVWPGDLADDRLVAVARLTPAQEREFEAKLVHRNGTLPEHKRIRGVLTWSDAFPRTASMKVRRGELVEQLRKSPLDRVRRLGT